MKERHEKTCLARKAHAQLMGNGDHGHLGIPVQLHAEGAFRNVAVSATILSPNLEGRIALVMQQAPRCATSRIAQLMDVCLILVLRELHALASLMVPGNVVRALLATVGMEFSAKILMNVRRSQMLALYLVEYTDVKIPYLVIIASLVQPASQEHSLLVEVWKMQWQTNRCASHVTHVLMELTPATSMPSAFTLDTSVTRCIAVNVNPGMPVMGLSVEKTVT